MDLVSIIVPIYNADKYLDVCIESILNQTYKNIELILINDGSTDGSLGICNIYEKKDERISVINKTNSGVSDTRNKGIESALGQYICFVDADDALDHNFVEIMYNEISNANADAAFCNYFYDYDGKLIPKKPRLRAKIYSIEEIKYKLIDDGTMSGILFGSACLGIYKKSILEYNDIKFNKDIKINEDGLFNIEYCLNIQKIKVLSDDYLYIYRQNRESASNTYSLENRTAAATEVIVQLCKKHEINMDLQRQLGARKVSEAFWMILGLCSNDGLYKYKYIKKILIKLLSDEELNNSYQFINLKEINRYKYIYYILMKNKRCWMLFILTRYIYPALKRVLSR